MFGLNMYIFYAFLFLCKVHPSVPPKTALTMIYGYFAGVNEGKNKAKLS